MFSIIRIFIAFFLQGILYMIIASIMQSILDKPLINNMIIFVVYFMLFVPNIIYAIVVEILQRYMNSHILFGFMNAFIGIFFLFVNFLFFAKSTIKIEALFIYFITYFIMSLYLKYLYNKANLKTLHPSSESH